MIADEVFVIHSAADAAVVSYMTADLERQGVRARASGTDGSVDGGRLASAGAAIVVLSPSSAADPVLRAAADEALRLGKPLFAVRLADVGAGDIAALHQARSWTDAFGPNAQHNVSGLAAQLRSLPLDPGTVPAPPAYGYGAPPAPPAYPAAPAAGAYAGAPAAAWRQRNPALTILSIVVGVLMIGIGAWRLYDSGVFGGRSRPSYSSTSTTAPTNGSYNEGVTDSWLRGNWRSSCSDYRYLSFTPPGYVTTHEGPGSYTRTGGLVTLRDRTASASLIIARTGPDSMSATMNGQTRTLVRCPS